MNKQALRSYVYDSRGGVMTTLFEEDRAPVKLADVPKGFIDAVLAIEDRRFYSHDGVDYEGTTRALFQNLNSGEIQQGGSTITQQLVKNTMGDPKKRDLKTKVREAVLALRLEHEMTKNQILEKYLNTIYFGNGAYGIQAAVERYFGERDPRLLTLGQAALLAGLIQSPETLNPITHPDRAARRRGDRPRRDDRHQGDHRGAGPRRPRGATADESSEPRSRPSTRSRSRSSTNSWTTRRLRVRRPPTSASTVRRGSMRCSAAG